MSQVGVQVLDESFFSKLSSKNIYIDVVGFSSFFFDVDRFYSSINKFFYEK